LARTNNPHAVSPPFEASPFSDGEGGILRGDFTTTIFLIAHEKARKTTEPTP
jgi:hypothetical protein